MKIKRILSSLLALALVMGCFAGCGKDNKEKAEEALMPSISTTATGRYALDMVMLEDGRLCHFTYNAEAPAVAETELNIYSLYPDDDMTQMITRFQKANPDISVNHEIGLTGEDGMTEADAVRTLNTEILAGNGPDLICLDGFNLQSYLEKGVLADISHILDAGDPLFRHITDCFAEDGMICAVPTTFTFPAMYGKEEYISQIHDLSSLVEAATQAKAVIAPESRVVNGMYPDIMADYFYDSCSASWMEDDCTLDGAKLTEFYAAMKELYALDEPFRQANVDWMTEFREEYVSGEYPILPGQYTGLRGADAIIGDVSYLCFGTLDGMYCYVRAYDYVTPHDAVHFLREKCYLAHEMEKILRPLPIDRLQHGFVEIIDPINAEDIREETKFYITSGKQRGIPTKLASIMEDISRQTVEKIIKAGNIYTARNMAIAAINEMTNIRWER